MTTEVVPTSNILRTVRNLYCPGCGNVQYGDIDQVEVVDGYRRISRDCKHCDVRNVYKIHCQTGQVEHSIDKPESLYGLMLVRRPDDDVYMVVEHSFYFREDELNYDLSYWVDSGTCPTNWLRGVLMISEGGDLDPHGVFIYVKGCSYKDIEEKFSISRAELMKCRDDSLFTTIFPEIINGDDIDGEAVRVNLITGG